MADLHNDLSSATTTATDAVVGHGSDEELQTAQLVTSGLDTVICRPYIVDVAAHRIDMNHLWGFPAEGTEFIEEKGERWGLTWVRQRNMKKPDGSDYVTSAMSTKCSFAPNPFVLFGIKRPGRPKGCTQEPYTNIVFGYTGGDTGYKLEIPANDA